VHRVLQLAGERTSLVPAGLPAGAPMPRVRHDVALGHRRFAILEMTPEDHQPVAVAEGRVVLSFQGEIYRRKVKMGFPFPLAEWLRAARPGFEAYRRGDDPPHLDRARVFAVYDRLAQTHPAYLWRCLSVLLWWDECAAIP
jgi:hypothetical protein